MTERTPFLTELRMVGELYKETMFAVTTGVCMEVNRSTPLRIVWVGIPRSSVVLVAAEVHKGCVLELGLDR